MGIDTPLVTETLHAAGPVDVYVRPGDLRVNESGKPGFDARILSVQRTGPIMRWEIHASALDRTLEVEIPHLHHDVKMHAPGQTVRLRLNQYSVFRRSAPAAARTTIPDTVLIGRERERLG